LRFLVKLLAVGLAIESIGLLGLVVLYVFVDREVGIWNLLPHPFFSQATYGFNTFDPNLGWYPATYMFGKPRRELPPKKPGEVRVFLLGGSTAWGTGATREDETIAERLEVYLNSDIAKAFLGGRVHVYNEGVPGYYSKQELILLITKIIPFQQPDVVVVLDGLNDFVVYSGTKPHIDRTYSEVWHFNEVKMTLNIERVTTPIGAIANAFIWSMVGIIHNTFFGNFTDQVVRVVSRSGMGLAPRIHLMGGPAPFAAGRTVSQQAKDYYLENIAMMKSICEGEKVKFFWFPQPVLVFKQNKTAEEETMYRIHSDERWQSLKEFYETTVRRHAVVRFGKASFFQDISDSLTLLQSTAYVSDAFHYSPTAQDVIAKQMAASILNSKEIIPGTARINQ
jgi:lysophospholipase L1-like esterase